MFERFTDRARRVVVLAQEEARLLKHEYIGTEHLLLGLLHEGEGVAGTTLTQLGVSKDAVQAQVRELVGPGERAPGSHIPFTPRAKKVLELSLREALQLGHSYIGTEHLVLGLIREGKGVAVQALTKMGVDLDRVRQQVIQALSGEVGDEPESATERVVEQAVPPSSLSAVPPEDMPACAMCRAPLATSAVTRVLDVALPEGGTTHQVAFVYCGQCGFALGVTRP